MAGVPCFRLKSARMGRFNIIVGNALDRDLASKQMVVP